MGIPRLMNVQEPLPSTQCRDKIIAAVSTGNELFTLGDYIHGVCEYGFATSLYLLDPFPLTDNDKSLFMAMKSFLRQEELYLSKQMTQDVLTIMQNIPNSTNPTNETEIELKKFLSQTIILETLSMWLVISKTLAEENKFEASLKFAYFTYKNACELIDNPQSNVRFAEFSRFYADIIYRHSSITAPSDFDISIKNLAAAGCILKVINPLYQIPFDAVLHTNIQILQAQALILGAHALAQQAQPEYIRASTSYYLHALAANSHINTTNIVPNFQVWFFNTIYLYITKFSQYIAEQGKIYLYRSALDEFVKIPTTSLTSIERKVVFHLQELLISSHIREGNRLRDCPQTLQQALHHFNDAITVYDKITAEKNTQDQYNFDYCVRNYAFITLKLFRYNENLFSDESLQLINKHILLNNTDIHFTAESQISEYHIHQANFAQLIFEYAEDCSEATNNWDLTIDFIKKAIKTLETIPPEMRTTENIVTLKEYNDYLDFCTITEDDPKEEKMIIEEKSTYPATAFFSTPPPQPKPQPPLERSATAPLFEEQIAEIMAASMKI
jgi:hypothetical protein